MLGSAAALRRPGESRIAGTIFFDRGLDDSLSLIVSECSPFIGRGRFCAQLGGPQKHIQDFFGLASVRKIDS
jgi:hypothetical protein